MAYILLVPIKNLTRTSMKQPPCPCALPCASENTTKSDLSIQKLIPSQRLSSSLFLLSFALLTLSDHSLAGSLTLAWDASPGANVGGYKLFYGTSSRSYLVNMDVGNRLNYTVSGLTDGATYYFSVKAYDTTRTTESAFSNEASKTLIAPTPTPTPSPTPTPGLVAAYGFEEVDGSMVADASGSGNHGTITEAVRIYAGRYGRALQFDGVNDMVTVKDSSSLDLSSGMTLEAWVYPTAWMSNWKTVAVKEDIGGSVYYLYANEDSNRPLAGERIGDYRTISGVTQLPANQWSHLASTYDGRYNRLYVNGVQVAVQPQTGTIPASGGALRIGGNSIWGEFFKGYIDELRIYSRALTSTEISRDLATAIKTSNPPQFIVGNRTIEVSVDSNPQGIAEAYRVTSTKTSLVTGIQVYLDASSTATEVVAGIYRDNNGHPGTLVSRGKSTTPRPGAWNWIAIPPVSVTPAQPHWIAILGSQGPIKFRDRMGSGSGGLETSAASGLTTLPETWTTGTVYSFDAPMSAYGIGY